MTSAKRPRGRRWTLADLDRDTEYRLIFDPLENRWEVFPGSSSQPLVTRPDGRPRRADGPGSDWRSDAAERGAAQRVDSARPPAGRHRAGG
jgi:predicted nucleic acid-binding Zn ribbon protein